MEAVEWVLSEDGATTILAVWGGVNLAVSAIVKATPSPKDDVWWAKVQGFLSFFAIRGRR